MRYSLLGLYPKWLSSPGCVCFSNVVAGFPTLILPSNTSPEFLDFIGCGGGDPQKEESLLQILEEPKSYSNLSLEQVSRLVTLVLNTFRG